MSSRIKYGLSLATLMMAVLPLAGWAQDCQNPAASFGGRGIAADVHVLLVNATLSDTGALPSTGGSLQASLASISLGGLLSSQTADASTSGQCDEVDSAASVAALNANLALVGVSADLISSQAQATCSGSTPAVAGSSQLTNLKINGVLVDVTGEPNQKVVSGLLTLVINEQITSSTGQYESGITVNALHLSAAGVGNIILSSSQASITCSSGGGVIITN